MRGSRAYRYAKIIINDKDRKPLTKIIKEIITCIRVEKEVPFYYFTNLLYKNEFTNYQDYIGHKKLFKLRDDFMNPNGLNPQLEDKVNFHKVMVENGISTPTILATNEGEYFNWKNTKDKLIYLSDFINFLEFLFSASSSHSIFIKPVDGIGAKNVFAVSIKDLVNHEYMKNIFSTVKQNNFIYQEKIIQHSKINKIYPNSINTIRVHTFFNQETNKILITSALMRIGSAGSIVDNGNLFIPINLSSWKLVGNGKSFLKNGAKTHKYHPDTGVKLDGLVIPYGNDIIYEVEKSARLFNNNFVGWDVAITPNGVQIIEGNGNPHLIMTQIASDGFRNHTLYKEVFEGYL